MKDIIEKFLKDNELIPLLHWQSFYLNHSAPSNNTERLEVRSFIKSKIGNNKSGLYLYEDLRGNILYIGIGKLVERIDSHFLESFKQVSGDRTGKWHRFFSSHQGRLKVYWLEIQEREEQLLLESILTYYYKPLFNTFEKK